jgi:hypothetical protein
MKTCSVCHQDKPISDFYVMRQAKDGYRPNCKSCFKTVKPRALARIREVPKPDDESSLKTCSKCRETKPRTAYFRHNGTWDGLRPDCKACLLKHQKVHYAQNREKILEKTRAYELRNVERARRNHREAHQRRMQNPDYVEKKRAYGREYDRKNIQKKIGRNQENLIRRYSAAICDLTEEQWIKIKRSYRFRCAYCGCEPDTLTMDHVIPPLHGGNHTAVNIVPACFRCNARKGAGPPLPFHVIPTAFVT